MKTSLSSFRKIYCLIFTLSSLYVMGDAFRRWDGVKFYASFPEFLPSVALVTILCSIAALFIAAVIWLLSTVIQLIIRGMEVEDFLVFSGSFFLFAILFYSGSQTIFRQMEVTYQLKTVLFLSMSVVSAFLSWISRNKSGRWLGALNERITPLVWLFGIFLALSAPLVAYHAWIKELPGKGAYDIGQAYKPDKTRPNIMLVTFDAMTALDMSVYGYQRPTTPFITQWAKTASVFKRLESGSNYTTPTTAGLMTGKRVWTHQTYFVEVASRQVREGIENIPFLLRENGYSNIALQQIHRASVHKLGVSESFDIVFEADKFSYSTSLYDYIDTWLYRAFGQRIMLYDWFIKEDFILFKSLNKVFQDSSETKQRPEKAFEKFLEILDNGFPEPYFAWIHLFPPHDPYLPPEPFMGMFNPSPELRTWKSQMKGDRRRDIGLYRARYDEFIRYSDKQFEDFIAGLEKRNVPKNTVIILSADHGESFEHNYKGHGGRHLYEQLTHIPLVIKGPAQKQGKIIDALTEQIDIPATILDLAGIPVPPWMEGRSLVPLLRGEKLLPRPAFSMNLEMNPGRGQEINKGTIAVWEGEYKLVHYLESGESLLFNLDQDAHELENLYDKEPEKGEHLLNLILGNLKKANEKIKEQAAVNRHVRER